MTPSHPGYNAALLAAAGNAVKEARGASIKFPANRHMHAALAEEVGELAEALLEHDRGNKPPQEVYNEAMQVAAMALRIAIEGSQEFKKYAYDAAFEHAFVATSAKKKHASAGDHKMVVNVSSPHISAEMARKMLEQSRQFQAAMRTPAFPYGDGQ